MKTKNDKMMILLLCGVFGCIFMGMSDWLMIYGDTAYSGALAWLTKGVMEVAPTRNALAMAFSFPAVILYASALFGIRNFFKNQNDIRTYTFLNTVGMTPWLCLHLFYVMILYLFAWLNNKGYSDLSYELSESIFAHLSWIIILSEVLMLLPFIYIFYLIVAKKSIFPKWMAVNNPLTYYIVLKLVTLLMPDVPVRLAFTNGLMSEAMIVWFIVFMIFYPKYSKEK